MRRVLRLAVIVTVVFRYRLDALLAPRPGTLWWLPGTWPWRRGRGEPEPADDSRARRIRRALETLGPVFVKLGQLLSVRPDLVPPDITAELAALRDQVAPFPGRQATEILEGIYAKPLAEVFASFDPVPIASASIAQVHSAELADGRAVVAKVVRPGIARTIALDVGLMRWIAAVCELFSARARRLRPTAVVTEYERIITNELDMLREGASAATLRRNFRDSGLLEVPQVHWEFTAERVLVLDRVSGIPVDDLPALRAAGVDLRVLAERGVEIFFTQVFTHNFFHADMHPGNIFVLPEYSPPRYLAVDFGIVGMLSRDDLRYLAENFVAFFNRDYRRVAELHIASGWVPPSTRVEEFEMAIRTVCEPIFQRPLQDISFGQLLVRLFQTAHRFDMEVQPQLLLLQKTLLHIEGLGRQLYPGLDLWDTAKPYLEAWMRERRSPQRVARALAAAAPAWIELAAELGAELPCGLARSRRPTSSGPSSGARPLAAGRAWAVGAGVLGIGWLTVYALGAVSTSAPGWLLLGLGLGYLVQRPGRSQGG